MVQTCALNAKYAIRQIRKIMLFIHYTKSKHPNSQTVDTTRFSKKDSFFPPAWYHPIKECGICIFKGLRVIENGNSQKVVPNFSTKKRKEVRDRQMSRRYPRSFCRSFKPRQKIFLLYMKPFPWHNGIVIIKHNEAKQMLIFSETKRRKHHGV